MITILGKPTSINVRKVLWLCAELQLPYALEAWGSGYRSTDVPEFRALNPNALVPVLLDGELVLRESNTICRYLASRGARTDLLPADPAPRAGVEQWMDWQATELNNAWRYAFSGLVRQRAEFLEPAAIQASVKDWNRHMVILDGQLGRTGAYVAGAGFTLADIVLGVSTNRWLLTPMERPALRAVEVWYARLLTRRGFTEHVANGTP